MTTETRHILDMISANLEAIGETRIEFDREVEIIEAKMDKVTGQNQRNAIKIKELLARMIRLENERGKEFELTNQTRCENCVFYRDSFMRNRQADGICHLTNNKKSVWKGDFCRDFQEKGKGDGRPSHK